MPDVRVYIREKAWIRLVRECGHDPLKARRKIAELVHEKYG